MDICEEIYNNAFDNELEKIAIRFPAIKLTRRMFKIVETKKDEFKKKYEKKRKRWKLKRKPKQYLLTEMFGK